MIALCIVLFHQQTELRECHAQRSRVTVKGTVAHSTLSKDSRLWEFGLTAGPSCSKTRGFDAPPPSMRLHNPSLEQELALSLCLRWRKRHGTRRDVKNEVKHEGLRTTLACTRSLSKDAWQTLHVTDMIDKNSWVAAADDTSWFAPRYKTLIVSPDVAKEIPSHIQLRHVHVQYDSAEWEPRQWEPSCNLPPEFPEK